MEQLIELTKVDASKYKDVINIFLKLQTEGGLKSLSTQLDKTFKNEIKFTVQELERIEKNREEKIDIEKQCESNLSLFKDNFQIIVQLLLENSFKSAIQDIPTFINKRMNTTNQTEEHTELQNTTTGISHSRLLEETPKSKKTKTSISSKSQTTGKKKKNKENSKKSIKGEASPNTSKLSSALTRIMNGGSMSVTSARSGKSGGGFAQEAQKFQNSSHISNISKRSSMFYSSPRSNTHSRSYVESEFNYIKGCGTFEASKRSFLEFKETGPGPSDYNVERSSPSNSKMRRSFSPTIGRAKKESWIQQLSNTPSPGPGGLYPSHHFLSK